MQEVANIPFEFRVLGFGFISYYERKTSPSTAVSSCPRRRASRLIHEAVSTESLDSRVRGNDNSGRSNFIIEFVRKNSAFGLNSKPETRNPKLGGGLWG